MSQSSDPCAPLMEALKQVSTDLQDAANGTLGIEVTSGSNSAPVQEVVSAINGVLAAARHALKEKDLEMERLRTILNLVPAAIYTVDKEQRICDMNPAAEHLFETTVEEARGRICTEVFACDCCTGGCGLLDPAVPKPSLGKVCELKTHAQKIVKVSKSVALLSGGNGRLEAGVECLVDITPQILMEEELREKLSFIENLIDTAPVVILVTDGNGRIARVNPFLEELSGFSDQELSGTDPMAILIQAEGADEMESGFHGPGNGFFLAAIQTKSGSQREVSWQSTDITNSDGEAIGRLSIGMDMTERLSLEADLRQAQKLESVGRLASGIAHEINTPIQFVGDSVHFLRDAFTDYTNLLGTYREAFGGLNSNAPSDVRETLSEAEELADLEYLEPEVPKAIERILDGTHRVATIVRAMKEFGKPDLREQTPSDLNASVNATLTISRNEYKYVADLETEFGDLPAVTCHIGDINQVILNLVVNASHAIADVVEDGGRGTIRVATEQDGDFAVVTVSDSGGGIPEAVQEKIFEPFFTTKEVGKGTGQGLAIAHSIVTEKHGGELSFESEQGVGTTFSIRIPINGQKTGGGEEELPVFTDALG